MIEEMRQQLTTTADRDLLLKADEEGIKRSNALDIGLWCATELIDHPSEAIRKMQEKIIELNKELETAKARHATLFKGVTRGTINPLGRD